VRPRPQAWILVGDSIGNVCFDNTLGHLGLTPQSINFMGGFKVQGRKADDASRLLDDAHRLQEAGCFALALEGIPAELAARTTEFLTIPTIGIGGIPPFRPSSRTP
jgi:3-methyl-2-oxobutanoate hydroxymethyltransferase